MSTPHPGMAMLHRFRALAEARAEELEPHTRPRFDGTERTAIDHDAVLEMETAEALVAFCDRVQSDVTLLGLVTTALAAIAMRRRG